MKRRITIIAVFIMLSAVAGTAVWAIKRRERASIPGNSANEIVGLSDQPTRVCVVFANGEPAAFARIMMFNEKEFAWPIKLLTEEHQKIRDRLNFHPVRPLSFCDEHTTRYKLGEYPEWKTAFPYEISKSKSYFAAFIEMGASGCSEISGPDETFKVYSPNYLCYDPVLYDNYDFAQLALRAVKRDNVYVLNLSKEIKGFELDYRSNKYRVYVQDWYSDGGLDFSFPRYEWFIYELFPPQSSRGVYKIPEPWSKGRSESGTIIERANGQEYIEKDCRLSLRDAHLLIMLRNVNSGDTTPISDELHLHRAFGKNRFIVEDR